MSISTPADTVLLTQISDGADHLRLVSDEAFEFTLKLNILFFDRIALGSPDLLGNRRLYDLYKNTPDIVERLFTTKAGTIAPFSPVLWEHNENITEVAERMSAANTIHSLQTNDDLKRHAKLIDSTSPSCLYISEELYRRRTFQLLCRLLSQPETNNDPLYQHVLPSHKVAAKALSWCSSRTPAEFTCSSLYRYLDNANLGSEIIQVKHITDTVAHYAQSSVLNSRISVPDQVSPIVTALRNFAPLSDAPDNLQEELIDTEFPILALQRLSLNDALKLRDFPSIQEARKCLNDFRNSGAISQSKIRDALDTSAVKIVEYAFKSKADRRQYVLMQSNREEFLKMRLIYNLALATAPIAVALFTQTDPKIALLSLIQVATYTIKSAHDKLSDKVQGKNMAYTPTEVVDEVVTFKPKEGRINM